ncbi:MAG: UDP-3-O-(3-hydroxymyristoyl)glucosamine N-acyltransferase [Muribaculaceae bacterium]|nr:UDP-3-O-(3-hydroxymyristoyl)glucosamine N-acyltransferase [Muribaculaceae bacterium]
MKFTASQIAAATGGTVEGDSNVCVSTFAKIEEAGNGALTFLANPKYTHYIYTTGASIVLVRRDFVPEHPVKATLVRVDDPYATLSQLLQMVDAVLNQHPAGVEQPSFVAGDVELPEGVYVGAFAYIAPGVHLGRNVKIYPQAYVGRGVSIGDDTVIYPGVKIYPRCTVGARCVLHSGAVIGADGFGFAPMPDGSYSKIPQIGIVEIADDVEIGANTTVDRATMGATRVGRGTKLDNLIQVAHNVEIGSNTVMASQSGIAGSTKLGSNCMVGGQVGLAGHIHVGDRVQIGAQSGIHTNIADDARIMGTPAVAFGEYARQTACTKRLPDMASRLNALERAFKKLNEQ